MSEWVNKIRTRPTWNEDRVELAIVVESVTGWPEPPLKGLQVYFTSRLERRAWWRVASVSEVRRSRLGQ